MRLQDLHGACGFIVFDTSFSRLCRRIAECPGVTFTSRRRFFWSASDIRAQFRFDGHDYTIEPESDDEGIWVTPTDRAAHYPGIQQIKAHLESPAISK
jgi:hypothetical protein